MELDKALADFLASEGIFQQMFDHIRLVEQDGHYVCKRNQDGSCSITDETCFSVWGRKHRCTNCVSQQTYNENRQHVKFEYANDRYYFVIARPVHLRGQKYALEFVMDVTNQFTKNNPEEENFVMNLIHELERVSSRDPFTNLFNKKHLQTELATALQEQKSVPALSDQPLYLSLWDIDNFKKINDTYGHDVGDNILLYVAGALQRGIKPQNGITARFGGDEFAILFRSRDYAHCQQLLSTIKAEIDSYTHHGMTCNETVCFRVSVSYGLADVRQADSPENAIHIADQQLYTHKRKIHENDGR
ncbi:diguanylate cyclase (GGDEF) domain-containing protein [Selenomonas sp. GACV-9]|nr:diguanylate cyclase (GGDEF) domain-containing protein [Selenomonas ruminantium]